jgi:hypothetical protein
MANMKLLFENWNNYLTEIDWAGKFQDVGRNKDRLVTKDMAIDFLNAVLENCAKPPREKEKLSTANPYVHNKVIPKDPKSGLIPKTPAGYKMLDEFVKDITTKPKQILSTGNAKMWKSQDGKRITINLGIPALKGLVYDLTEQRFYIVNTCPGAGDCILVCYARKGMYVASKDVFRKQTRVLNFLLNYPEEFQEQLINELRAFGLKRKNIGKKIMLRWNDSGDFFAAEYYNIAKRVTKELMDAYAAKPDPKVNPNIASYAYTKMAAVATDAGGNVGMNFSKGSANKKQTDKISTAEKSIGDVKASVIVGTEIFEQELTKKENGKGYALRTYKDGQGNKLSKVILKDGYTTVDIAKDPSANVFPFVTKSSSFETIKQNVAAEYGVDIRTIVSYDQMHEVEVIPPPQELLQTYAEKKIKPPVGSKGEWLNVIIMPTGDGDDAAQRDDVLNSFLCVH